MIPCSRRTMIGLACLLAGGLMGARPLAAQQALDTVVTRGVGTRPWLAMEDVLRRAVTEAVRNTGRVDTAPTSLILDETRAELFGVFHDVELVTQQREGPNLVLEARVIVSTANLNHFLEAGGQLPRYPEGPRDLPAQAAALQEVGRKRALYVSRLFRVMPRWSVQLTTDSVELVRAQEARPARVKIVGRWRLDPAFVQRLTKGLQIIGEDCGVPGCRNAFTVYDPGPSGTMTTTVVRGINLQVFDSLHKAPMRPSTIGGPLSTSDFYAIVATRHSVAADKISIVPTQGGARFRRSDPNRSGRRDGLPVHPCTDVLADWRYGSRDHLVGWNGDTGQLCLFKGYYPFSLMVPPEMFEGGNDVSVELTSPHLVDACWAAQYSNPRRDAASCVREIGAYLGRSDLTSVVWKGQFLTPVP